MFIHESPEGESCSLGMKSWYLSLQVEELIEATEGFLVGDVVRPGEDVCRVAATEDELGIASWLSEVDCESVGWCSRPDTSFRSTLPVRPFTALSTVDLSVARLEDFVFCFGIVSLQHNTVGCEMWGQSVGKSTFCAFGLWTRWEMS